MSAQTKMEAAIMNALIPQAVSFANALMDLNLRTVRKRNAKVRQSRIPFL